MYEVRVKLCKYACIIDAASVKQKQYIIHSYPLHSNLRIMIRYVQVQN